MAPSSPSPPEQSPGERGSRLRPEAALRWPCSTTPTDARPEATRTPSSDRPALPARTHWPHARVRPPARPSPTPEATCSARPHVQIRRPPWHPTKIRHPPRSTRPPAKLGLPARNATPTHPPLAAALGSRGPLTRTLPARRPNTARRCVGLGNFGERFEMAKFNFCSGIML
ncbi:vegetative cell wall protein gp1-like [Panicum hallii]|uniref:vegetative cell wall protein gp1-like n=1 Tax=Panicum hallii TaxID=206008 RepID=UPI000DF4EE6A|nr:vegetative cell wall protein gp1-like [Panicum hallii]